MATTVKLSKSLQTHKGEINELELNEPTARAFFDYAEPFKMKIKDGRVEFEYNNVSTLNFMAQMSGVDMLILKDLPAKDYMAARVAVTDLILGVAGESPTAP